MLHKRLSALKVQVKCLKEVGHLTKSVGHTQSTLVGHLSSVMFKDLERDEESKVVFSKDNNQILLDNTIHWFYLSQDNRAF